MTNERKGTCSSCGVWAPVVQLEFTNGYEKDYILCVDCMFDKYQITQFKLDSITNTNCIDGLTKDNIIIISALEEQRYNEGKEECIANTCKNFLKLGFSWTIISKIDGITKELYDILYDEIWGKIGK